MSGSHRDREISEATRMRIVRLHGEGVRLVTLIERFKGIVSDSSIRKILKDGDDH